MPRVTELWAWVVADTAEDDEGVPGYYDPDIDMMLPMIGADGERVQSLRPKAQEVADILGKPIYLRRAKWLEEVEVVHPRAGA